MTAIKPIKVIEKAAFNKYLEARREEKRYNKSYAPDPAVADFKKGKTIEWYAKAFVEAGHTALTQELERINGRAKTHTYNYATDISHRLESVELDLRKRGVTQANLVGTTVTLLSEVPTAKAYARRSRTAIASLILAERRSTGWYVTKVEKIERWTGPGGEEKIVPTITAAARDDIVKTALDGLIIQADVAE